jgi:hypothetical protein
MRKNIKKKLENIFVPATENYKIDSGTYNFLVCETENGEASRDISIKCKFLKTAIRRVIGKVDSNKELIDYEVAVYDKNCTTFIDLHSLGSEHPIYSYLS